MSRVKLDKQVGGNHYEKMPIQPIEYILANKLGFVEGSVIKYVSRWPDKGGVEDLKKARQLLDMKISELEAEADSEVILPPKEVRNLHTRDYLYDLIYEDDDILSDFYKITDTNKISIPSRDITIECDAGETYDLYPIYRCMKRCDGGDIQGLFHTSSQVLEWIKENIN